MSKTRLKIFIKFVIEDQINLAAETDDMEYLGDLTAFLLEFGTLSDMADDITSLMYYSGDYDNLLKENEVCNNELYEAIVDVIINYMVA